jgi:hypothetical protein
VIPIVVMLVYASGQIDTMHKNSTLNHETITDRYINLLGNAYRHVKLVDASTGCKLISGQWIIRKMTCHKMAIFGIKINISHDSLNYIKAR